MSTKKAHSKGALPELSAEWILQRAHDDGAGHLIWTQYSQRGHPKANWGAAYGIGPFNVRRAIWRCMTGHDPGSRVVRNSCGVENCIEPACLECAPRSRLLAGRKVPMPHRAAIAAARRAQGPLSATDAEAIRRAAGMEAQEATAARLGVCQGTVHNIQAGKSWRDYRSPFEGLMP